MKWLFGGFAAAVFGLLARRREEVEPAEAGVIPTAPVGPSVPAPWTLVDRPGRHWTWEELSVSDAAKRLGLDNTPTEAARVNLRRLCAVVLDPPRESVVSVRVTSAYRSVAVNRAVGGVANSRHLRGLAADVVVPASVKGQVTAELRGRGVKVIVYKGHLHVALVS